MTHGLKNRDGMPPRGRLISTTPATEPAASEMEQPKKALRNQIVLEETVEGGMGDTAAIAILP